jgi:hypothetical protein
VKMITVASSSSAKYLHELIITYIKIHPKTK